MNDIALAAPSRLETRDLRLIVALATARTTAAAAKTLHLTQPAVSRALMGLEQRLDVSLFDRTPRGLEPTEAGRTLLASAPRLLQELNLLEAQLRGKTVPKRHLRLVCECYTAYHWMPSVLQTLKASLPGIDLSIALECTGDPIGALQAGELDVALITEAPTPRSPRVGVKPLFFDEVLFIMSASHRLASRASLTRADLEDEILFAAHVPTRDTQWFPRATLVGKRGDRALTFQAVPLTEAIVDFARAGLGIGVLSEWLAEPHLKRREVLARRLASGPILRPWRLMWRREVEEAALQLFEALGKSQPRGLTLPPAPVLRRGSG
ncbi:MAG: LysR family transcriptional regulator [Steroidobacteraceae bacterium]